MPNEKHLEFLQSAIGRMAGNSLQMKTWSVGIATAAIGFAAAKESVPAAAMFGVAPILAFWGLDAYYLALEKCFRDLFETERKVVGTTGTFDMKPTKVDEKFWACAFRPAVVFIHLPMAAVVVAVALLR
jgi:hypothetical protein